jgi:hypothetical protein
MMRQWVIDLPEGGSMLVTYWEALGDIPEHIEVCLREDDRWSPPLDVRKVP